METAPTHIWVTADGSWGTIDALRIVKVEDDVLDVVAMYTEHNEPDAIAALAWVIGEEVNV